MAPLQAWITTLPHHDQLLASILSATALAVALVALLDWLSWRHGAAQSGAYPS
ncbi:hypothetical protein [Ferrimonas balearica]|uniref:hypothetical protein n=1 Tax=Ferrimonas balearica TaxID=44012 RepID=UPI001C99C0A9|nr:hypothetical protein [Ferrimonas balearica]MBY5992348.1 hypothetical protein [Ferrimonas balearica]